MEVGKRTELLTPEPGEVNPWRLLGHLQAVLDAKRRITKTDWNEAVAASTIKK